MEKELIKIIKKFEGSVLAIGLNVDLIKRLEENMNILDLDTLNLIDNRRKNKFSKKNLDEKVKELREHDEKYKIQRLKTKKINIKKLRKYYNKKKTNYLICNYEEIKRFMKYFIKDSVYINNNMLYLYGISLEDVKTIVKKYKRYNVLIKPTIKDDYFILEIDNKESKNNKIKDFFYLIHDTIENVVEFIGDILIN